MSSMVISKDDLNPFNKLSLYKQNNILKPNLDAFENEYQSYFKTSSDMLRKVEAVFKREIVDEKVTSLISRSPSLKMSTLMLKKNLT